MLLPKAKLCNKFEFASICILQLQEYVGSPKNIDILLY